MTLKIFSYKKVEKPLIGEEIKRKAASIRESLSYDSNVMFVEKIEGKTINYFYYPFSVHLALGNENRENLKAASVSCMVEIKEGLVITKQSKNKHTPSSNKLYPSASGMVEINNYPYIEESLFSEVEEELGIRREELKQIKYLGWFSTSRNYKFLFHARVEMSKDELKNRVSNARDSWEIEEILIISQKDLKELNAKNFSDLLEKTLEGLHGGKNNS